MGTIATVNKLTGGEFFRGGVNIFGGEFSGVRLFLCFFCDVYSC